MFYDGVISSKEAGKNPGLCPVWEQKSGLCCRTRAWNRLSSLSLGSGKSKQ